MHSGNTHERQPNFRHGKKKENRKIERGEFITPPRPTGRRSNKTPAQAFTPPTDETENGHNLDICVLRRLRLTQGQMQEFLGLKLGGGGSSFANMGFKSST